MNHLAPLRQLLTEPTFPHWESIKNLFSQVDGIERKELLEYAQTHMEVWPEVYRSLTFYSLNECKERFDQGVPFPLCRGVTLFITDTDTLEHLPLVQHFTLIHSLSLFIEKSPQLAPEVLSYLFQLPAFQHLKSLSISTSIDETCSAVMQRYGCFQELEYLNLELTGLNARTTEDIFAEQSFPSLQRLRLTNNPMGDKGATILANRCEMPSLKKLFLGTCGVGDVGAKAIAQSRSLPPLELLRLTCNQIGTQGGKAFFKGKQPLPVEQLEFAGNPMDSLIFQVLMKQYWKESR